MFVTQPDQTSLLRDGKPRVWTTRAIEVENDESEATASKKLVGRACSGASVGDTHHGKRAEIDPAFREVGGKEGGLAEGEPGGGLSPFLCFSK